METITGQLRRGMVQADHAGCDATPQDGPAPAPHGPPRVETCAPARTPRGTINNEQE